MKEGTGYHYTESGLDNVYLASGFSFVDGPGGRKEVVITDIDGLHDAIGAWLVDEKESLSGKEIRFLRQEMLLSQGKLAKLLNVSEQAVQRWEKGKTEIPKPAEALIRFLYREHLKPESPSKVREILRHLADLENTEAQELRFRKDAKDEKWKLAA